MMEAQWNPHDRIRTIESERADLHDGILTKESTTTNTFLWALSLLIGPSKEANIDNNHGEVVMYHFHSGLGD